MAKVIFILDVEEGHVIPTFSLAAALKNEKHEVVYLAFADSEQLIKDAGFEFETLFPKHYPKGFKSEYRELVAKNDHRGFDRHFVDFADGSFDELLKKLQADIYIVSSFLTIEMLFLYYKYDIKPIVISPRLYDLKDPLCNICVAEIMILPAEETMHLLSLVERTNKRYSTFLDLVSPISNFVHFILCSREFDSKDIVHNNMTFYIGDGGYLPKPQVETVVPNLINKKVIYASMGTQVYMYRDKYLRLYSSLKYAMQQEDMRDYHVVLSLGGNELQYIMDDSDTNITVIKWADQRSILAKSSISIVHGGLGTIKECIYAGVPMIVIPGARDQPINAQRVEEHNIGMVIDILSTSKEEFYHAIRNMLSNREYKENILLMKDKFDVLNHQGVGLSVIKEMAR